MSQFEIVMIALTVLSVLAIPALVLLVRAAIKWTKTDDRLEKLVEDVSELVRDKEKAHKELADAMQNVVTEQNEVHKEMYAQMRTDRSATDTRLRFIEEYWMKRGQG